MVRRLRRSSRTTKCFEGRNRLFCNRNTLIEFAFASLLPFAVLSSIPFQFQRESSTGALLAPLLISFLVLPHTSSSRLQTFF